MPSNFTSSNAGDKRRHQASNGEQSSHGPAACLECRNRKVKCNRELPKCSNCKKSGVPCQFPNPEKKTTQMKQLSEDVATFNGRLSNIEKSLVNRMQDLTDLVAQSMQDRSGGSRGGSASKSSSSSPPPLTSSQPLATSENDFEDSEMEDDDDDNDLAESTEFQEPSEISMPSRRASSVIYNDGSAERFYGPSSTFSHLVRSRGLVESLLNSINKQPGSVKMSRRPSSSTNRADLCGYTAQGTSVLAEIQRRCDSLSGPSNFKENLDVGDDMPLELPPRQVLEDAIEAYTAEPSLELPLFHRQTLDEAVVEQYAAYHSDIDESWVLCFNSIILRSSSWKARAFRFNSFTSGGGVDNDVLHLLLSNANRAVKRLEKFCGLRLVNVQALFLLALVSHDLNHFSVFERIFDRVCQLAKQTGLHERGMLSDKNATPEAQEAQNLLWLLYSMDKYRVFVRGPPCRIYRFECDLELPLAVSLTQKLMCANLRLNCLIEHIYRQLYSPKASKLDHNLWRQRIMKLDSRLSTLASHVETLANGIGRGTVESVMILQLRYAFSVTRLLIHSNSISGTDDSQSSQHRLETARAALQIIQALSKDASTFNGGVVALERVFSNYSVIAFHEVFENLVKEGSSASSSSDLELLTTTANVIRLLSHPERPYSYCTRLHKNFSCCAEIATLLVQSPRKSSNSSVHRSSSSSIDNSAFTSRDYFGLPSRLPALSNYQSNNTSPPYDIESDDVFMDGEGHGTTSGLSSATLSTIGSNLDANDFDHYRAAFAPYTQNMSARNDFGMSKADPLSAGQFSPSFELPIDSTGQMQDTLDAMFEVGNNGLDANFQHGIIMSGGLRMPQQTRQRRGTRLNN